MTHAQPQNVFAPSVSHLATPRPARRMRRGGSGPVSTTVRLVLLLMYGVPILWIIVTSLKPASDVQVVGRTFAFRPTIIAYSAALHGQGLVSAGIQSLIIAVGATAITVGVAAPAAYGLARLRGAVPITCLAALIILQMMPQTATVIPLFQVLGRFGLLDSRIGVILADAALLTPWAILLLRPFFRAIPIALEESAAIDGASSLRTFVSVVLPIARNGMATTATLVFILSWGEFLYAVNFFLSPGTYPLSAVIAQQITQFSSNWPGLMALSVLTSIPILVLFAFTYRLLREGLTLGAVK